jgi:hypothetical protein
VFWLFSSGPNPSRNDGNQINSFAFSGTFTNGTTVPDGSYRSELDAEVAQITATRSYRESLPHSASSRSESHW